MLGVEGSKNLLVESPTMGSILIQPSEGPGQTRRLPTINPGLLLFPKRMESDEELNVAAEWAACTQSPIFCHAKDISKLIDEGFGSYRFNKLEGYREIFLAGGVVEFYPARRALKPGLRGMLNEAGDFLHVLPTPSFHVLIRPTRESSVLYLSSPRIDAVEWKILMRAKPSFLIGAESASRQDWQVLSLRSGKHVTPLAQAGRIRTALPEVRPAKAEVVQELS
jgi:hypothetical protein